MLQSARPGCVILTALVFAGCVAVPTPEHGDGMSRDFRGLVGPAGSGAPIEVGTAARVAVFERLGEPARLWADQTVAAYQYTTVKGYGFVFYPGDAGGPLTWRRDYFLYLRFDGGGTLRAFRQLANPYSDNDVYQIDTELYRFVNETGPPARPVLPATRFAEFGGTGPTSQPASRASP